MSNLHHIKQRAVCAGTDTNLVNLHSADFFYTLYVVRRVRASGKRNKLGKINLDFFVIFRVGISRKLNPYLFTLLRL